MSDFNNDDDNMEPYSIEGVQKGVTIGGVAGMVLALGGHALTGTLFGLPIIPLFHTRSMRGIYGFWIGLALVGFIVGGVLGGFVGAIFDKLKDRRSGLK